MSKEKKLKLRAYTITNCGLVRKNNEDNFFTGGYIPSTKNLESSLNENFEIDYNKKNYDFECIAVFDGMGGMNAGERASSIAAEDLKRFFNKSKVKSGIKTLNDGIDKIQEFAADVNNKIYSLSKSVAEYSNMGTTFVSVCIIGDEAVVMNIGDSRGYLYAGSNLTQLSSDHTIVAELLKIGQLTKEEAEISSQRNRLTRHLGMSEEYGKMVCAVSDVVKIEQGYKFIICSDGINGQIDEKEIEKIMKIDSIRENAKKLVEKSLQAGGSDNMTVTIVELY